MGLSKLVDSTDIGKIFLDANSNGRDNLKYTELTFSCVFTNLYVRNLQCVPRALNYFIMAAMYVNQWNSVIHLLPGHYHDTK